MCVRRGNYPCSSLMFICLNVMLALPPSLNTPAVLVTVLQTCQTTPCHTVASPLNYGPCFQPYPPPVWWWRHHLHHSRQPLLSRPTPSPLPPLPLLTPLLTLRPSGIESTPCRQCFHLSSTCLCSKIERTKDPELLVSYYAKLLSGQRESMPQCRSTQLKRRTRRR